MTLAPEAVRSMFDRIAPVYDAMNRVMTAGLDLRWRRLAASEVVRPGDRVLDAACGTGDLALADHRAGALEVTGLDFSPRMLERARRKAPGLALRRGRPARAAVRRRRRSTPRRSASGSGTSPTSSSRCASCAGSCVRAAASRSSRSRARAALLRPFFSLWFDRLVPLLGRLLPGGGRLRVPAGVGGALPRRRGARRAARARRVRRRRASGSWRARSSPCTLERHPA